MSRHNRNGQDGQLGTVEVYPQHDSCVTKCLQCSGDVEFKGKGRQPRFCGDNCRQRNHQEKQSLKLKAARFLRRRSHQSSKLRFKAFVLQTGLHGGPNNTALPRTFPRDLSPFLSLVTDEDLKQVPIREAYKAAQKAKGE